MKNDDEVLHLFVGTLPVSTSDCGSGRPFLVLHGGAGPKSVSALAGALSENGRAIVPTHPGFEGLPKPEWFRCVGDLALAYLALLERMDAREVILVGNSFGGWIAAEMALRNSPRVAGLVLLCAVGIDAVSDRPIVDPMALCATDRAAFAFHDPDRFAAVPKTEDAFKMMAANQKVMVSYSDGAFMHDPTLIKRLAGMSIPSLVIWGESDRIVDIAYGRRYADSIPGANMKVIAEAGHFPQIESLERVVSLINDFLIPE